MKQFGKVAVPVVAIVLAIMAGTAAYATRGGPDDEPKTAVADESGSAGTRAAADLAAICVAGQPDCDDTVECADASGCGDGGCTPEECMVDPAPAPTATAYCPPDSACIEPRLMVPPLCPDGVRVEECAALARESGRYDCAVLESEPPQLQCKPIACVPVEPVPLPVDIVPLPAEADPGTTLIAPADDVIVPEGDVQKPPPEIVDPPVTVPCPPVDPCADDVPGPAETCVAPDCPVNGDGALDCGDPCADDVPDPTITCLPPDCAVSSDGAIACPEPRPLPGECEEFADGSVACSASEGCAVPAGKPVDAPCVPPNCRVDGEDAVVCDEEPSGSSGAGTSGSGTVVGVPE